MENRSFNFKVSSYLKDIIGRDLVTDKYVAIFELVKNSVDAKAKKIDVIIKSDEIIIKDDGKGMSLDDIENKWFFIGYSEKKESKEVFAGNKGIGRFSADNLARKLRIITTNGNCEKVVVDIDWLKFEENQKSVIDGINIPYKKDICHETSGTTLILTDLRTVWTEQDILKLKRSLEKLENPFEEKRGIEITLTSDFDDLNGTITNNLLEILDEKSIVLNVTINNGIFSSTLLHNGNRIVSFSYIQNCILEETSFRIYHLSQAAKQNFTRRMGTDFKNYGNIFVYRNGFRIYPYGELDFDIFKLNLRKTQGVNRYLGLRDIIGSISIKDTKNNFKEVTSRDNGFVTNPSYLELQEIYMEYHRFLEDFMQISIFNTTTNYPIDEKIVKRFAKKDSFQYDLGINKRYVKVEDVIHKIDRDLPLTVFEKQVIKDENRKVKLEQREVQEVRKENKELQKKNANLEKEITIKNIVINTNDNNVGVSREMFNHHINTEINEMKAIMKNFKASSNDLPKDKSFVEFERSYYEIVNKLNAIKSVVFSVKETSIGKSRNNIVHFINDYSLSWSKKNKFKIEVFTNDIKFEKNYDIVYLVIILDNLFENAVKTNARKIDIIINSVEQGLNVNFVSRDSVKDEINLDRVFDFGYTTRRRGTGMGMYFVKKISEEQLEASVSVEILNGSDFVTSINMR